MTLRKQHIIQLLLIAVLTAIVSCSSTPEGKDTKAKEVEIIDFSKMPSMVGDSIHTLVSDSGRLAYRMKAPKLAIFDKAEEPYWDFPDGIHMTTYDKEGHVEGDISSKIAVFDIEKELWTLSIGVEAINTDGTKLETELLYWNQKEERIYSDKLVKITEDGMITIGHGFESDQSFQNWHMDDFTTEFVMDDE